MLHAVWMLNGGWQTAAAERRVYVNLILYLTLTMEQIQNTWNIVHENLWCFRMFCAFVGLKNNTIVYAEYRIWIGLVWPIPDPAENASIGADTDTEYRINAS